MRYSLNDIISKLRILPLSTLKPHEERIGRNLKRLKEAMLNIGQLVDPVIVDKKSGLVIDGNHRVKVLEIIKVPNVVCQVVNYDDPSIQIGGWFPSDKRIDTSLFKNAGIRIEEVDEDTGKKAVNNMEAAYMLKNKKGCFLIEPNKYNIDTLIEEQERIMKGIGNNFDYVEDTLVKEDKNRDYLIKKIYTKDEIKKRAMTGKLFPPKSTRHMVPDRIIRLNMRLGWLHQDKEEAWLYLKRLLKNRVYAGNVRRYVEPVIVIY